MNKDRIAVCIEDAEYRSRLVSCLMKHYQNQVELHVFETAEDVLKEGNRRYGIYLLYAGEEALQLLSDNGRLPIVYLEENMDSGKRFSAEEVYPVQMYQEVNVIMEEVLSHVRSSESEISDILLEQMNMTAVYSLSDAEDQLLFSATLQAILAEDQRVLFLDLQESSGFSQLMSRRGKMGLEDLLLMVQSNSFSRSRVSSCIGHRNGLDFVYPVECPESLCEVGEEEYQRLFSMLAGELDYQCIVLNLGMRFRGFLDALNLCKRVYLLRKQGSRIRWREDEFMEELQERGYERLAERIMVIEIPSQLQMTASFERLIEEWKWNEPGDSIRRTMLMRAADG